MYLVCFICDQRFLAHRSFLLLSDLIFSGDNVHLVQAEIQKRIMREFGYPDSFACEVFRHAPDLIEDSSSSSGSSSSRHSTLSKVCFFFSTVTHLSSFVFA